MDPKQALVNADQAISDARWAEAIEALNDYAQWRFAGGYAPPHLDSIRGQTNGDKVFDALMFLLVARLPRACEQCDSTQDVQDYNAGAPFECEPEWLCDNCRQNKAEGAAERQAEDYYGGSSPTLAEQQEQARRLK